MNTKPIRSIYLLVDPRTMIPFYVGVTTSVEGRLKTHSAKYGKRMNKPSPTQMRVNEIIASGSRPQMVIVEQIATFDKNEAFALEKRWIDRMIEAGNKLTNRRITGEVWYGGTTSYYFDDDGVRHHVKVA